MRPQAASLCTVILLTICAALSKENGILVIAYIAAIELSARYALPQPARHTADRSFFMIAGVGTLCFAAIALVLHERILAGYFNRDFTLGERLLTQPRVLVWYLKMMFVPNINDMGLIHDYWLKSTGLLKPAATLVAILFWVITGSLAWLLRFRAPLLLFGLLWFLLGHVMESSAWPLLLVFEHRNYLPFFGIIFAACTLSAQILHRQPFLLKAIPATLVVAVLHHQTHERSLVWSEDTIWIQAQARNHPNSPSALYLKGDLFAKFSGYAPPEHRADVINRADHAFQRAWELYPEDISPLIARVYHWSRLGLPVRKGDLRRAATQIKQGHVPIPTQNAVLTFCKQIRRGDISGADDLHKQVVSSMLRNPVLSEYIREPLQACENGIRGPALDRNVQ